MNRFELTLDLDKRGGVAQWVTLRQGDRRGTELQATIYDHGVQVGSGYTCRVVIRRPDVAEYYRETCEYSLGVATVTIDEQYAAAISGSTYGYFELLQGGSVIASTESFGVRILPDATADATVGPEYDSAIDDALAELDEATGRISQMVVDATEEYLEAHPELTTTVEDNSLTDAKLVQSGGILDRVARLMYRLDNLLTATPAEADALTVTDAAQTPMAGLALYGRSTQDGTPTPDAPVAIQSVTPNLFATPVNAAVTGNAPSYNVNLGAGGTVAFAEVEPNTTYTARRFGGNKFMLFTSEVDPSGGGTGLALTVRANVDNPAVGYSYTFTTDASERYVTLVLNTSAGGYHADEQATLLVGDVMLPFVAYGGASLWARGRNLYQQTFYTSETQVRSGVTYTYLDGGSFMASGTATANASSWGSTTATTPSLFVMLPAGTYTVAVPTPFRTSVRKLVNGTNTAVGSSNSGVLTFTLDEEAPVMCYAFVASGATVTNAYGWVMLTAGSTPATEYVPYAESTTPIPLQGHALRSLPDGTRDEVVVGADGHATLVQRVGSVVLDGSESGKWVNGITTYSPNVRCSISPSGQKDVAYGERLNMFCDMLTVSADPVNQPQSVAYAIEMYTNYMFFTLPVSALSAATVVGANDWLVAHPVTVQYPLATPVTIDLGTVDPVALQGPDMTAQAVPTAPFALTYERDLNVTLARLEAAIAEVATS